MARRARAERLRARLRGPLPDRFERRTLNLAPRETRPSGAAEWAGAIVLIDSGEVEVGCVAGARRTFAAGDIVALSCLPLRWLRNVGTDEARIVAVRRSAVRSTR